MARRPDLRELDARCKADPKCREPWMVDAWPAWKHVLRDVGKRECIAAVLEAVGSLEGPCTYPLQAGYGFPPYDVHERCRARLHAHLVAWPASDDVETRRQLTESAAEWENVVAEQRKREPYFVVGSSSPPVEVFVALAGATTAHSSFEVRIREALSRAWYVNDESGSRFRAVLLRSR
jgi:hypothetical protein